MEASTVSHFVQDSTTRYSLFDISFWYILLYARSYAAFFATAADSHSMDPLTIVVIVHEFTRFFAARSITKKS